MVNTRQSNKKDGQKIHVKVTPIKLKQKQKTTNINRAKAVKKKISTKHKVTMPKKIYNVNSPPVKTTTKLQKKTERKLKFKKLKNKKNRSNGSRHMLTMHSEICAFDNVVVMFPLRQYGSHGFVYNIHAPVMKTPETKHSLMKEKKLDVSYPKYLYL